MAKTKTELATTVLRTLGIVGAVDSPSAADSAFVVQEYENALPYWGDLGLVYWPSDEIPEAVYSMLVTLVANRSMNAFGIAQSFDDMLKREDKLLVPLRRHCAKRQSGFPTRVDHY